ncbi:hypothetical protein GF324_00005, partial [bacterium]|nr:hypothetical protein [bacterium]MBD3238934.1 hypothetical protein [Chitinivibrionales bacterium]
MNTRRITSWGRFVASMMLVLALAHTISAQGDSFPLGIGLSFPWGEEWYSVNLLRHAPDFWEQGADGTYPWNTGEDLDVGPDGYPATLRPGYAACTMIGLGPHRPAGDYVLLWDGDGDIVMVNMTNYSVYEPSSTGTNRKVYTVTSSYLNSHAEGMALKIVQTNPANPVRNVRFLLPGFEATYDPADEFHPLFLDRIRHFKNLRFKDWSFTDQHNSAVNWSDRVTPAHPTFAGNRGVAPEFMVRLANKLNVDPWFC